MPSDDWYVRRTRRVVHARRYVVDPEPIGIFTKHDWYGKSGCRQSRNQACSGELVKYGSSPRRVVFRLVLRRQVGDGHSIRLQILNLGYDVRSHARPVCRSETVLKVERYKDLCAASYCQTKSSQVGRTRAVFRILNSDPLQPNAVSCVT